jgi:hypothetical protein
MDILRDSLLFLKPLKDVKFKIKTQEATGGFNPNNGPSPNFELSNHTTCRKSPSRETIP